jgi:kynurenine formamidase
MRTKYSGCSRGDSGWSPETATPGLKKGSSSSSHDVLSIVPSLTRKRVLLFEPATTLNTGNAVNERTNQEPERIGGADMLIDLSHTVEDGMITYKGLPAPIVCDFMSREASRKLYAPGTEFQIGKIEMVANTGTYLDSPFHRYADGKDLSDLPLERLADLEAVVVRWDCRHGRAVGLSAFEGRSVRGKAVLVHTGWSAHWRTDHYFEGHPFLTRDAAEYLQEAEATLVGIDSYNIDDTDDMTRPVHSTLLKAEIPIVEHMIRLERMPEEGSRFFAVPVKVKGMGTFPVRAFGIAGRV